MAVASIDRPADVLDDMVHLLGDTYESLQTEQEQQGNLLYQQIAFVTDGSAVIRRASHQAAQVFRSTPDALTGRSLMDLAAPGSRSRFEKLLAKMQDGALADEVEIDIVTGADQTVPVRLMAFSLNDMNEHLIGLRWLMFDMTAHKALESELFDTQKRLRAIFDQAAVGMAYLSLDGHWERVNQRLCELLGYTDDAFKDLRYEDVVQPDDLQRDAEKMQQLLNDGVDSYSLDMRYRHHDGSFIWVRQTASLMRSADNRMVSRIVVVEDITERRQARQDLLEMLKRAQDSYDISRLIGKAQTPPAVVEALVRSTYLDCADRALVLLFDKPWDETSPTYADVLVDCWLVPAEASLKDQRYTIEPAEFEEWQQSDGSRYIVHTSHDQGLNPALVSLLNSISAETAGIFPLWSGGQWYGVLLVRFHKKPELESQALRYLLGLIDQAAGSIYTMVLLTAEAAARREAERANQLKMRLLATISHELRTPLTSIKGFASTLLAEDVEWDAGSQKDFIQTINAEADKLTELIEQLLDVSRLDSGTLKIVREPHHISDIMEEAMAQLHALTANHELIVQLEEDLLPVYVDVRRVAQVVTNLVNNAVKYAPEETPVKVQARREGDFVRVDVIDRGTGISEEDQQRVFEAFQRGQGDTQKPGVGLGLAICKGVVDAHEGEIWIAETSEQGTTISFTLPLAM